MSSTQGQNQKAPLRPIEALKIQLGPNQISEEQATRIREISEACLELGKVILANSKPSADQTVALRKLRELKYTITSGISGEEFL